MSCQDCGQDVPGISSLGEGEHSCTHCGAPAAPVSPESAPTAEQASPTKDETAKADPAAAAGTAAQRPPLYDGWDIDEQLRHVRRVLSAAPLSKAKFGGPAEQPAFRLDAEHGVPSGHLKRARRPAKKTRRVAAAAKQHAPGDRPLAILAWVTLLLGTAGFVAGLALMGWSMDSERQDLWAIGAPIILAGQIVLILGLVLQLDRIWRDSRWAAARLETVDEQLHELITTTTLLGDLKGQLDLLAVKLSRQ